MKKIVTLFATVLLLYGCGSVPLTGQETDAVCIRLRSAFIKSDPVFGIYQVGTDIK